MSLSFMTDVLLQRKWSVVWERMAIAWQTESDIFLMATQIDHRSSGVYQMR